MRFLANIIFLLSICASVTAQTLHNISDEDTLFSCPADPVILDASYEFQYIQPGVTDVQPSLIDGDHTSEGFMVTLSDGRIVHIFRLDPGDPGDHISNYGRIVKRSSYDNGLTWQPYLEVYDDPMWDDRNIHGGLIGQDSIVLFFRNFDSFFMVQIGMYYLTSFDGGQTWSTPQAIYSISNGTFGSHRVVKVPGLGFIMSISGSYYVELRYSPDGLNWNNVLHIWDYTADHLYNFGEVCFTYVGNGKIIGLVRNTAQSFGSTYYQVTSSDFGQTWTTPVSTNIAQPFFCPAPMLFYDTVYNDLWVLATDRRNYVGSEFYADSARVWVYKNKIDEIFTNPGNYSLVTTMLRPEPSYYRFYGYPTYTRKSDGNYLVVFTEAHKKWNNLEDANFYQFEINYNNLISESTHYLWDSGETSQTIAPENTGTYIATSSDDFNHNHTDSVYVNIINNHILQNNMTVEPGTILTLSCDTSLTQPTDYTCLWSTGDTVPVIHPMVNMNSTFFLTIDNGVFTCIDSIKVDVKIPEPQQEEVNGNIYFINSLSEKHDPLVTPNPFSSFTRIYIYNPLHMEYDLKIFDLYGNLVRRKEGIREEGIIIYREQLNSGIYIFRLTCDSGNTCSGKLIVQ